MANLVSNVRRTAYRRPSHRAAGSPWTGRAPPSLSHHPAQISLSLRLPHPPRPPKPPACIKSPHSRAPPRINPKKEANRHAGHGRNRSIGKRGETRVTNEQRASGTGNGGGHALPAATLAGRECRTASKTQQRRRRTAESSPATRRRPSAGRRRASAPPESSPWRKKSFCSTVF